MIHPSTRERRVVVTGTGAVTPWGAGTSALSRGLRAGRSAVGEAALPPLEDRRPVALLSRDAPAEWQASWEALDATHARLARRLTRRASRGVAASATVALEAWHSAGLCDHPLDPHRVGVVVGGHALSLAHDELLRRKFERSPHHLPPSYALQVMDAHHVGVVSALLGAKGEGFSVGGASASGQAALVAGARLVRLGVVDVCVVIGALAELTPMMLQAFDALGALCGPGQDAAASSRPFDRARRGFVPAQAAAALVVEGERSARARGAPLRAYLAGAGVCLDGSALPTPSAAGEARAMRGALEDAGLAPEEIDLVNAHGTSSGAGDPAELEAIHDVFGACSPGPRVQATKALLGHSLWAAGTIEAVAVVIQLEEGYVHGHPLLDDPLRDDIRFVGREATPAQPSAVLSNSFGFFGINTSVAFKTTKDGPT